MKYLKKYNNINEAVFDTSILEDILLDITDEGFGWNISLNKRSDGESNIVVYITYNTNLDIKLIFNSILRVDKYLLSEGYHQSGNTDDILDEIENGYFQPEGWISGYIDANNDPYFFTSGGELSLQLTYSKV